MIDPKDFPETIFHEYTAALLGEAAPGINASAFAEPSPELLANLQEAEELTLKMMDKWFPHESRKTRLMRYQKMVRYWDGICEQYAPEAIIFAEVPHEIYSYVLYAIAKERKIKTIMFENVLHFDRLIYYYDYKRGSEALRTFAQAGHPGDASVESLSPYMQKYWHEYTEGKPAYNVAFARKAQNPWRRPYRVFIANLRSLFRLTGPARLVRRLRQFASGNAKTEYVRYERVPIPGEAYVYVPLNYQPERTTLPQAGRFVDQRLMIEALSEALPAGWKLYVKEHPMQWYMHGPWYNLYRPQGFYEAIAKLPGVVLLDPALDSFALAKSAKAVATANGTASWEAVLRGVPALVFGWAWFMHAPGLYKVENAEEARSALARIAHGERGDERKLLNYLVKLDNVSFAAALVPEARRDWGVTIEENRTNMLRALREALAR